MEETLATLHKYFPALPQNALIKIYKARTERMRILMIHGIPNDIRWVINARVYLSSELSNSFVSYIPGFGKNTYSRKHRVKQVGGVCYKCACWMCNTRCHYLGMVSDNHEDKIRFIRVCAWSNLHITYVIAKRTTTI